MSAEVKTAVPIYILLYTATDADKCQFPDPEAVGCYLSLREAQEALDEEMAKIKEELDERYDREEHDGCCWQMYQDGYGAACYVRLEIVTSKLDFQK